MINSSQRGQILLIVVLVMVVALAVGLSLASRSITDLKVNIEEQNSAKALSAAEAGVEEALQTGSGSTTIQPLGNNASIVNVSITNITNASDVLINNGNFIPQDDGADIWLTNYNTDITKLYQPPYWSGNMTFYWGTSADTCSTIAASNTMAALEVFVISGSKGNPVIARYAFDPCSTRKTYNNFTNANFGDYILTTTNGLKQFAFKTNPIAVANGLIVRVIPLYAGASIWANGTKVFPSQGRIITSRGVAGSAERKILYFQGYESVPVEYFYALLSQK